MGIGGFMARPTRGRGRGSSLGRGGLLSAGRGGLMTSLGDSFDERKKQRRPMKRRATSQLEESFPAYLQEAFFGRPVLDRSTSDTSEMKDDITVDETDVMLK